MASHELMSPLLTVQSTTLHCTCTVLSGFGGRAEENRGSESQKSKAFGQPYHAIHFLSDGWQKPDARCWRTVNNYPACRLKEGASRLPVRVFIDHPDLMELHWCKVPPVQIRDSKDSTTSPRVPLKQNCYNALFWHITAFRPQSHFVSQRKYICLSILEVFPLDRRHYYSKLDSEKAVRLLLSFAQGVSHTSVYCVIYFSF